MTGSSSSSPGYKGRWAFVDLTTRTVRVLPADDGINRDYVGGRGVQARLLFEHLKRTGPLRDPLSPENRIIIGTAAPNDTPIATAGRGSCSFIGTMTRSPKNVPWVPGHVPVFGLITHSSGGGLFHNMLKRAGFDHLIIDGRADSPVRLLAAEGEVKVLEAEDDLFQTIDGRKVARTASAITDFLSAKYQGSSTVCLGPGGWNLVDFACLTADYHRNFGRGGAGAVFGSKNLVAVTASGKEGPSFFDEEKFRRFGQELDRLIRSAVDDPQRTVSFRPATGTTWWLDRAFNGGYLGNQGGYLPWHNFDEGYFDPAEYAKVGTDAFLKISGKPKVCNRCRHILCTRSARVTEPPYSGEGVRPEFETIALWINCCITDRDAIFHMNALCNDLGLDTMTFGSVMAGAMELGENGFLKKFGNPPRFGDTAGMIETLKAIAYRSDELGRLLANHTDRAVAMIAAENPASALGDIAHCLTTTFGGLGYAGVHPKAFPGMFTAYGTSNRGRGDHTYAWTIQAEESGLRGAGELALYVAEGQAGKALIDSLGLCDFFVADVTSDLFLELYQALTGISYSAESLKECGRRIYALERHVNNFQGRGRAYDSFVPPKLTVPLSVGAHKGEAVDVEFYNAILDAYYAHQGWTNQGYVEPGLLEKLGIRA
jgi:aldehyde:ferredoxin oxidoreductase